MAHFVIHIAIERFYMDPSGGLVTSPLGFKARVVLPNSHCGGECNVHFLRSTSGATHC